MFCNRCGTEVQPGLAACPQCGRRYGDPVAGLAQSRLERHLRTLGTLWMVIGGLFLIPAVVLLVFGQSLRFVMHGQEPFPGMWEIFLAVATSTLILLATGGVCVGIGLMQRAPWARTAAIVLGILALFHPPLGTALGVYSLWVLLADEGGNEYRNLARAA